MDLLIRYLGYISSFCAGMLFAIELIAEMQTKTGRVVLVKKADSKESGESFKKFLMFLIRIVDWILGKYCLCRHKHDTTSRECWICGYSCGKKAKGRGEL